MSAPVLTDADLRAAGYEPIPQASNRWSGGYCPGHGAYPMPGCVTCPPAGHPLHVAEAERAARHLAAERGSSTTDAIFAFLACLLIGLATVALVVMGRAVMCDIHADALSYCPDYVSSTR